MSGEVPKGWREVRIGQIAREVSIRNHGSDNIPVLSMTKHRGFVRSNEYFSKSVHSENTEQYKIVKRGQFAYATIHLDEGSIDYLKNEDMGLISPMYTVFETNPEEIDPVIALRKFKQFALSGRFTPYSNGGVNRRKSILFRDLSAFKFALPPLTEQRAIAEVLGAVEEAIANTEALIEALIATKNEILEDRLRISTQAGWEICRLRDVATIRTGISKSKDRQFKDPLSVPYLRVANVQDGYLDLEEIKMITIEQVQLGRYSLQKGDVLFNEGGDFDKLGRGCVWSGQISPCVHQNHVFVVRCKPKLNPEFLALLAASRKGKAYFRLSSKQTTNLASINTSDLRSFPVLLPPMDEQLKIAAIAKTFDQRATAERASLALLEEMRSALAQELLSGRVRLPDSIIARHRGKAGQEA
ncbi:restriction endonuclease subunit S [Oceanibaculum pacificum]|uniref:restriction endonuclease subunit S n=1 Tax=Oceanibaculum pacificum TaxID=580166 RepID=UPI000A06B82C|nr:restriction endonuclease subunit S [Oceanibaculum pacificum]